MYIEISLRILFNQKQKHTYAESETNYTTKNAYENSNVGVKTKLNSARKKASVVKMEWRKKTNENYSSINKNQSRYNNIRTNNNDKKKSYCKFHLNIKLQHFHSVIYWHHHGFIWISYCVTKFLLILENCQLKWSNVANRKKYPIGIIQFLMRNS